MQQATLNFDLTNEEAAVLGIIEKHRGKGSAILGKAIGSITGIEYDRLRAVISHLVNDHGYLIASNSKGYYVPVTADEISEATRSLRHRAIMILVRASRLQKISLEEIFHQARMEFGE
jgi:hypothetical protein